MKQFAICLICLIQLKSFQLLGQNTADYYLEKGKTFFQKELFDSAIATYNQGITAGANNFDKRKITHLYVELGNAYKINGQFSKALFAYHTAAKYSRKTNDSESKGRVYIGLIEYYRATLDFVRARNYIALTKKLIDKDLLSKRLQAEFYSRCAAIENEGMGESEQSKVFSWKVLKIASEINDEELKGTAYNELGYTFEIEGNFSKALLNYQRALQAFERNNKYTAVASVLTNIGRIHARGGRYDLAIVFFKRATELCEQYQLRLPKPIAYESLAKSFEENKDYKNALIAFNKYNKAILDEVELKNEIKIAELDAKFDLDKQQIINQETLRRAFLAEKKTLEERRQVNYWILVSIALIFLVLVIAILGYRLRLSNQRLQNSNEELVNSIDQKNALFKELHHRVKNNLTVLKSILFLHSKSSKDKKIVKVLQDCQSRIDSMAIVHQNLYDVEDSSRVEIDKFLNELISQLEESMLPENEKINVYLPASHVVLDVTKAVFLGIIFNELVTNSFKYASSADRKLRIGVVIKEKDDELIIKYWDNGDGFSSDKLESDKGGFGFKLIQLMVKQLSSDLKYYHRDGKSTFKFTVLR